jgi:hypothetical protein
LEIGVSGYSIELIVELTAKSNMIGWISRVPSVEFKATTDGCGWEADTAAAYWRRLEANFQDP